MHIAFLAAHEVCISRLARWSFEEWSHLHLDRMIVDVERLMLERSNKSKISLGLVEIDEGKVIGMIALRKQDLEFRPNLTPWLAGLYVVENFRRRYAGVHRLLRPVSRSASPHVHRI